MLICSALTSPDSRMLSAPSPPNTLIRLGVSATAAEAAMAAPTPCGATGSSPILKSSTPRLSRASSVSKP